MPLPIAKLDAGEPNRSSVYDVLMRLAILAWSAVLALVSVAGLEQYVHGADPAIPIAVWP